MTVSRRTAPRADDRGATLIFATFFMIVMLAFAALAVDISNLSRTRQNLYDTLDAASLAGAALLPDGQAAYDAAMAFADANSPGLVPTIEFWCIVAEDGSGNVDASQIPTSCDPGPGPYTTATYPGLVCDDEVCAIPCDPLAPNTDVCNSMTVSATNTVDYAFAPVIGVVEGDTGLLLSSACKGACGVQTVTSADLALVVDRTGSMRSQDLAALKVAARHFYEILSPGLHDVALGTLGRSASTTSTCPTAPSSSGSSGPWIPVSLRNDYDLTDTDPPENPPVLNDASRLVLGIDCLSSSSTGTNLGDPIRAAGDHLLSFGRPEAANGIVFMTDGEATRPNSSTACSYAMSQAQSVEDQDIAIVAIAYRLQGVNCGGQLATTVLAAMASDPPGGPATADDGGDGPGGLPGGCTTAASIAGENSDGDNFLCAPNENELATVFISATTAILADLDSRTQLVQIP